MNSITREWHLPRNCSLSPRDTARAYAPLLGVMLGIGAAFALRGIWMVLVFAVLNIGALTLALLHYARHATDCEHIRLSDNCLLIERVERGRRSHFRLDPYWTRIVLPSRQRALIVLEARGVRVEVGEFVSEVVREQVGKELLGALRDRSVLA